MSKKNNNAYKDSLKYSCPDQQEIYLKMIEAVDQYQKSNSYDNREFLCYLTAAIYLTYKKLYPQLSIYIPFRTKSDASYMANIKKEFEKYILDNSEDGSSFDILPITKDLSGIRIIIDHISDVVPGQKKYFGPNSTAIEQDNLWKSIDTSKTIKNPTYSQLVDECTEFLSSHIQSGKNFLNLKLKLLEKIIEITPKEFTKENDPEASFETLYKEALAKHKYFTDASLFPTQTSLPQRMELEDLLGTFKLKLESNLEFEILKHTLPIVFNDPLITNALSTDAKFSKHPKKANGFEAIYYDLNTPFGPIEVQSQSNKAYYEAIKGSAYHSKLDGKEIDVSDFFQVVDPNEKEKLNDYIEKLDSVSSDSLISEYKLPKFKTEKEREEYMATPEGIAFLESEKYREMMKHIKLKEEIELPPQYLPKEFYKCDENGKITTKIDENKLKEIAKDGSIKFIKMNCDEYLFLTALSLSPYMNVCSSGHTSFSTAGIHHKKIVGEFAEVLRRKDSNTCLRDFLIKRLDTIIKQKKESDPLVIEHDNSSAKLPKDISERNILSYAERLQNKVQNNSELAEEEEEQNK